MNFDRQFISVWKKFNSIFWIANALELFERLAFYGTKAVLAIYLAEKVGLSSEAGSLTGLFSGLIYALPVFSGVLVDRYGFRNTLMACFAIFAIGYFLIGMAGLTWSDQIISVIGKKPYMIIVLILTAVGGSLIKPCIVGTVAVSSTPESKPLGFSIYYTLVNIGGAIGPVIALNIRNDLGIEYVLLMSSFTSFLLFLGTILFFTEPKTENDNSAKRTFSQVFREMLLVFGNFKFIVFLIIFSGFWIMFWQIFYAFPFYVKDVLLFSDFELLEIVDAVAIIFLTVPMAALVKRWKPLTAMSTGVLIASLSWFIIGLTGTVAGAIAGIACFALGEAIQAPRFYDYVSTLAPNSQVGTYMGFAFLPIAIGSFAAGPLADWLRQHYLATQPDMMWYTVAFIGLLTAGSMIIFNRILKTHN
jgi:POT family proton-dependent oligopeptide transporter